MSTDIPQDLVPFVDRLIAERRYLSKDEVVAEGLRLLQAREALRQEVQAGFEQLDAGRGIPADEVYARVEERIRQIEEGENGAN